MPSRSNPQQKRTVTDYGYASFWSNNGTANHISAAYDVRALQAENNAAIEEYCHALRRQQATAAVTARTGFGIGALLLLICL